MKFTEVRQGRTGISRREPDYPLPSPSLPASSCLAASLLRPRDAKPTNYGATHNGRWARSIPLIVNLTTRA